MILILRGLPGSGKSSYVKTLRNQNYRVFVCSADNYFLNDDGEYNFIPSKIGEAHEYCFSRFMETLESWNKFKEKGGSIGGEVVVVDNTNTQLWEMTPYIAVAKYNKVPFKIVQFTCSPETSAKRNTHGVPLVACQRMHARFEKAPRYWPQEEINTED